MSQETRKIRFGLWYDFRNPAQWRQPADRLYREILDCARSARVSTLGHSCGNW